MAENKETTIGRKTKYKPEYDKRAKKLSKFGLTDEQMAAAFDVAPSTFHLWKKEHPSFSESLKVGKADADSLVEEALFNRAVGKTVVETKTVEEDGKPTQITTTEKHVADTTAMIFWLKNRQPEKWRDKIQHEEKDHEIHIHIDHQAMGMKKNDE